MMGGADFDALPTEDAWQRIKSLMCEAATLARESLQGPDYARGRYPDAAIVRMYFRA